MRLYASIMTLAVVTASAQPPAALSLHSGQVTMRLSSAGLRYEFELNGRTVVAAHAISGLVLNDEAVTSAQPKGCTASACAFAISTKSGERAAVEVRVSDLRADLTVTPEHYPAKILFRTAGVGPSFGVGDRASEDSRGNTDLTGLVDDHLLAGRKYTRLTSNFVVFPRQGMAEILDDPLVKMLHLTADENAQGVVAASRPVTMHYFFGTTKQIYAEFLRWRDASGYPVMMPKYAMFGVGWEAFGALGWDTNQATVKQNVDHYLALGFPLSWATIGSGFWPSPEEFHETTSFGMIDKKKYPDMAGLIRYFHSEGLKVFFGLRITFITNGPFAAEGVKGGYFLKENGEAKVFKLAWPKLPCYVLDAQNPAAVDWYMGLVQKWLDLGVDGFKEDMFGFSAYDFRDDKLDPVSQRLMQKGVYLVERNGYIASDGDLHRIDDFNYDQVQDRGPVNALSLAYAGLPLIFPDIVGGTFGEGRFDTRVTPRMETYFMRDAQWASVHPSMAFGEPPWSFRNPLVGKVMLQAAKTHARLQPYFYSQAVRFVHDGYPWTMAPLPVAFPHDEHVYGRENKNVRGYEWMIGDALLATPLYGDDYDTAQTRDVYLPEGKWMDYDTGKIYQGGQMLMGFRIPVEKTPLFVGGTGIVIEREDSVLMARIYSLNREGSTQFWDKDAKTSSTIQLHVKDWKRLHVLDTTAHRAVPTTSNRFAEQFALVPGHNYVVR